MRRSILRFSILIAAISFVSGSGWGRANFDGGSEKDLGQTFSQFTPAHCIAGHRVGQLVLGVNNNGTFGTGFTAGSRSDCFTGLSVPSCEYPKNSNSTYLFAGAFWIGAVVGRDTLVSVGADGWSFVREFFPDESPFGDMKYRSIQDPSADDFADAVSEEDYIAVYTDTITDGVGTDYFGRPHVPLHIEVTQASYAWSYSYAEDFVLFDYQVRNIGVQRLEEVYMGIYVDADVWNGGDDNSGAQDDVCGFLYTFQDSCGSCGDCATEVFTAWIADANGDFGASGEQQPVPNVTATRIVRTPQEEMNVSFNWWISDVPARDFGPRRRPLPGEKFRDFRTGGLGTPEGDVNKYYMLRNGEFDYSQCSTAVIRPTDSVWMYPDPNLARGFAIGEDTRYLLSFGPFEIDPGQTLPISFAYVGGKGFHATGSTDNHNNLPDNPAAYYAGLDFSDLAKNSNWADKVYDNPGVDSDGDGYFGEICTCPSDSAYVRTDTLIDTTGGIIDTTYLDIYDYTVVDTCWVKGDGVPDFRGASAPPAPDFWLKPDTGSIGIRFNGLRSETTPDRFSNKIDFEGYRVYLGRDLRKQSLMLMASYDVENYNKWVLTDPVTNRYELFDVPFSPQELKALYAPDEEAFDPLSYSRSNPYIHPNFPESVFFFDPQDYNVSQLGIDTPIRKIYPHQPYPSSLIPDSAQADELTDDGYLKYFEYEVTLDNLLPSVEWFVNVTAFDFGSPVTGLAPLESSPTNDADSTYAQWGWDDVLQHDAQAYVYPNPYRLDDEYYNRGLEGRNPSVIRPQDRTRVVHFANLPPKCNISIFTLDGDLVRGIEHDMDPANPQATHDEWNLITRNTQLVVPGLYYWTIEAPGRETQIGKLVIIM
ncbi:MAG: hypothetical protein ABIE70_08800 [bacterium]